MTPFHLAIQVHDLEQARAFYINTLGCAEGRSDNTWVDFNFHGHQLVCHLDPDLSANEDILHNPVDGHNVPVPHFGVILSMEEWESLADRLIKAKVKFVIEPYIRFSGMPGEQATMFFYDPSGNAIEIKAFRDIQAQLFARQ